MNKALLDPKVTLVSLAQLDQEDHKDLEVLLEK